MSDTRDETRTRRRFLANVSIAARLSLMALLVTLVSLAVTAAVGLRRGSQLADEMVADRMTTVAASRATEIEVHLTSVRREIVGLAASPAAIDAIESLASGYARFEATAVAPADRVALAEHYQREVVPALEEVRGARVGVSTLVPDRAAAIHLQHRFGVPPRPGPGAAPADPSLVLDPGDGSAYGAAHADVHPIYSEIAARSGYDDLYLIAADDAAMVYSVEKRIDFGTSLDVGPHSGTALATLIDGLGEDPVPGVAVLTDYTAYAPALDRPVAFVASPVLDGAGGLVGFVAAALSTDPLDAILTGADRWSNSGETGETYLAGADGTMRTAARPFVDDPDAYLAAPDTTTAGSTPRAGGLTDDQRRRIAATGTTALVQPVNRRVLDAATAGPGVMETVGYRGVGVLSAYRPIALDGVDWVVVTEAEIAELDRPIERYGRDMLFAIALFVVVVTFVVVRWSGRVLAPVREIAARLRVERHDVAITGAGPGTGSVTEFGASVEFVALADNIDEMLRRLAHRRIEVATRAEERRDLVRRFLPAAMARRSEEGTGDLVDHVGNATAVVLVLHGLGRLVAERPERQVRDLLARIVDEADSLAAEHGLERVRATGDSYSAVCGVNRPYLDHAPRSVGFARAARELVVELAAEHDVPLALSAGVDAGSVSVGVAGRSGLVYDAWGTALAGASDLAHHASIGEISMSAAVRRQLPAGFGTDEVDSEVAVVDASGVGGEAP